MPGTAEWFFRAGFKEELILELCEKMGRYEPGIPQGGNISVKAEFLISNRN